MKIQRYFWGHTTDSDAIEGLPEEKIDFIEIFGILLHNNVLHLLYNFRWLLGYKNILRSIEYAEKSGIYGLRFISTGLE